MHRFLPLDLHESVLIPPAAPTVIIMSSFVKEELYFLFKFAATLIQVLMVDFIRVPVVVYTQVLVVGLHTVSGGGLYSPGGGVYT